LFAREVDTHKRPVTIVTHLGSTPDKDKVAELLDVLTFNRYYGWYVGGGDLVSAKGKLRMEFNGWLERYPDKPFMITEYGADTVAGLHDVEPVMFTEEYQVEFYKANHEVFDEYEHFVGEQVWSFADFQTSQGIIRVQGNKKGIFTRERKPKYVAHDYAAAGRKFRNLTTRNKFSFYAKLFIKIKKDEVSKDVKTTNWCYWSSCNGEKSCFKY
jgi:beta-glucuronidase